MEYANNSPQGNKTARNIQNQTPQSVQFQDNYYKKKVQPKMQHKQISKNNENNSNSPISQYRRNPINKVLQEDNSDLGKMKEKKNEHCESVNKEIYSQLLQSESKRKHLQQEIKRYIQQQLAQKEYYDGLLDEKDKIFEQFEKDKSITIQNVRIIEKDKQSLKKQINQVIKENEILQINQQEYVEIKKVYCQFIEETEKKEKLYSNGQKKYEQQFKELRDRIQELNQQNVELSKKRNEIHLEIKNLKCQINEQDQEIKEKNDLIDDLQKEIKSYKSIEQYQSLICEQNQILQGDNKELKKKIELQQQLNEDQKRQLIEMTQQNYQQDVQFTDEINQKNIEIEQLKGEKRDLQKQVEQIKQINLGQIQQIQQLESNAIICEDIQQLLQSKEELIEKLIDMDQNIERKQMEEGQKCNEGYPQEVYEYELSDPLDVLVGRYLNRCQEYKKLIKLNNNLRLYRLDVGVYRIEKKKIQVYDENERLIVRCNSKEIILSEFIKMNLAIEQERQCGQQE